MRSVPFKHFDVNALTFTHSVDFIMLLNAQLNDAALPECVHSLSCKALCYSIVA